LRSTLSFGHDARGTAIATTAAADFSGTYANGVVASINLLRIREQVLIDK
jgi:hypothetical protein